MIRFSSGLCALTLAIAFSASTVDAQVDRTPYSGAKNRFGILGGLNYNMVGAGQMNLPNTDRTGFDQFVLQDGWGLGPYAGLMYEYNSGGLLGFQARATYDDRRAQLRDPDKNLTLDSRLAYLNIEPALRLNLGEPDFHMVLGPSIAFNINNGFTYSMPGASGVGSEFENLNDYTFGLWGGFGYDILLSNLSSPTRWYLSPFIEGSWMFDQAQPPIADNNATDLKDNVDDNLSTVTIRAGIQLKFGAAPAIAPPVATNQEPAPPTINVDLRTPERLVTGRTLQETFPLRNYIFFESGSTSIPARYTTISNSAASNFNEETLLEIPSAGLNQTDRSARQMSVYYNALNIYASRLRANPNATITLNGAGRDVAEGRQMAENVKNYMVSTFGIPADRIKTQGSTIPVNESGTARTPKEDLGLVAQENRRVEVLSDNPEILKPVMIRSTQNMAAIENDLVLNVNADQDIDRWSVVIEGEGTSEVYNFPGTRTSTRIAADPILKDRANGNYTARVMATTRNGQTITREHNFRLVRQEAQSSATAQRYSILFEYDDSRTVQTYEDFLRNQVAPNIPNGATVYIHGHTDKVGLEEYNLELSARRATEVRTVLQNELSRLGRTVTFDTYGYGEAENNAPFNNDRPEGRYYNRTVVMEVVPR